MLVNILNPNIKKKIYILFSVFLIITQSQAQTVTINDIRNFLINEDTVIKIDGITTTDTPTLLEIIGTGGYKIRFRIADDVNATISQGTFSEIDFISDIKGPVTSTQPLTILDQAVFTTSETVLINLNSINNLKNGDILEVSGAINAQDNSIELSRLELKTSLVEWRLRGFARNINVNTFTIGSLTINLNSVVSTNCSNGFINNTFVSITATDDPAYSSGQPLRTLTEIECQSADVDEDSNDSVPVVVEGVISELIDLVSFEINSLTVFFDDNTSFDNGEIEHIDVGTKIEIQGLLDTNSRTIDAETIRFIHHRVKITAPVSPTDIILNQSIDMMGITIQIIPQTRDDDAIISAGINSSRQIEMRGFVDLSGNVFAQRIKDKGSADQEEVSLRGDLTAINQPFITLLGVTIDTSDSFFELNELAVDLPIFFAQLQIGMQLAIDDATYDLTTNTLSLGDIQIEEEELEDDPDEDEDEALKLLKDGNTKEIIGTGGIGIATVTGSELMFFSGFESP